MVNIDIYNGTTHSAKTSYAFGVKILKELMREYKLTYSVANTNKARQYILPGSVHMAEGQKFDLSDMKQNSGSTNLTTVNATHVGYRLSKYILPANYAFFGTISLIGTDILYNSVDINGNRASAEFSIGSIGLSGTYSFELGNTQKTTARAAILAMVALGVEADFDNFVVNFPVTCGSGTTKTFEFGVDLVDYERTWSAVNGWTYTIRVAVLQRIPGHEGDIFEVGDPCIIKDRFIGDTVTSRIISYNKALDDPTQDTVTIGKFAVDLIDKVIATNIKVDAAQAVANNSVQIGTSYNSVSISHEKGFSSISQDGLSETISNGTDGFVHTAIVGGKELIIQMKAGNKPFAVYYDGQFIGGAVLLGAKMYMQSGMLTSPDVTDFYGIIGKGPATNDGYGLFLVQEGSTVFHKIWPTSDNGVVHDDIGTGSFHTLNSRTVLGAEPTYTQVVWDNGVNSAKTIYNADGIRSYKNGEQDGMDSTVYAGARTLTFKNGKLTNNTAT